ncbi:EboA domain-containing protein [Actinoplanes utahensis]|uniref:Sugar phosphate isomerase n=1 Tax=Actinoplanes utahensis TaxID=1869 RepID=A0A0A6UE57_ACTUT|nr:EboA domain-containing protein [Actinoplanes utahensis]KHD73338.1 hypothetical protein MB27_34415 [Actinoplanes utahensis]GIF30076.1 hypothetical protein Aut01nite_30620 [Actinoplanes utahensis]
MTPDEWLPAAQAGIRQDPTAAARLLAEAPRRLGRASAAARVTLLTALAELPDGPAHVAGVYWTGDSGERLAVLAALPSVPQAVAVPLLEDALRSNDARLVAAALGPAATALDQGTWRQGVLKCVFLGIPLAGVHDLDRRADPELIAMLGGLAAERDAAGRALPADAAALLTETRQ